MTKQFVGIPDFERKQPKTDHALIFVFRENAAIGTAPIFINDSGTPIGDLHMGGFLVWERPAGRGTLRAKIQINQEADIHEVDFKPETTYYFTARLVPGYIGGNSRASLTAIDAATAATIRGKVAPPIN